MGWCVQDTERTACQAEVSSKRKTKPGICRQSKAERIHCQQTCPMRNDGGMELQFVGRDEEYRYVNILKFL